METQEELTELNRVIRDYGIEQGQTFQSVESTGLQTLDGVQALLLAMAASAKATRATTGRVWSVRGVVMQAMFTKVQSLSASQLIGLMQKLMPYVTTLAFCNRDRAADRRRAAARRARTRARARPTGRRMVLLRSLQYLY